MVNYLGNNEWESWYGNVVEHPFVDSEKWITNFEPSSDNL